MPSVHDVTRLAMSWIVYCEEAMLGQSCLTMA